MTPRATTVPDWLDDSSIASTLRNAEGTATREDVVDALAVHVYRDVPRRRLEAMVEETSKRLEVVDDRSGDGEPVTTDDTPRARFARYADVEDLEYLSDREFARVFAVVIEQFGGSTRLATPSDDVGVDLFWNRAHDTVAFRTITRPTGHPVGEEPISAVVDDSTTPSEGRSPSVVAVVGNTSFSDAAIDLAEAHDVQLFDGTHVSRWLSYAKIAQQVQGAVLEDGDRRDVEWNDLLEGLEESPAAVRALDPLAMDGDDRPIDTDRPTIRSAVRQPIPVADARPESGTLGALYADPAEDGDFGAFDAVLEKLDEVSEE